MKHLLPLLSLQTLSLNIIGGSILSRHGLLPSAKNITTSLLENKPSLDLKRELVISSLSFSQAIPKIDEFNQADIFVFYFGTSIGWPRMSRKMENHLNPKLLTSTAFHIPAYKSLNFFNRVKAKLRYIERYLLKLLMFPFGLYRPRHSLEDLPDLIQAIVHIADKKTKLIIWVQHISLGYRRMWLERKIYKRYCQVILKELENHKSSHIRILIPGSNFLVQENYVSDGIHLSEIGHLRMGEIIAKEIDKALAEAKEYWAR